MKEPKQFVVRNPWGDTPEEVFRFTLLEDGLHEGHPSGDCGPDPTVVPSTLTGRSSAQDVIAVLAAWYSKADSIEEV